MQNKKTLTIIFISLILLASLAVFASAVVVDADYATLYSGEQGKISIDIENNENFDIESVSLALDLSNVSFSSIGGSEETLDDLDEGDDDTASFTLIPATDIIPGDYNIPYILSYVRADNNSISFEKTGSFGIRVSARTDLDFSIETNENAIVGEEGRITVEIINRGLGEVKSVSAELIPSGGFEILSGKKVFVGTIESDDSDTATFNVIFKGKNPLVSARITYKDFDNQEQTEIINLDSRVYTQEEARALGLIEGPSYTLYIVIAVLILVFFIYRTRKKRKKRLERQRETGRK